MDTTKRLQFHTCGNAYLSYTKLGNTRPPSNFILSNYAEIRFGIRVKKTGKIRK